MCLTLFDIKLWFFKWPVLPSVGQPPLISTQNYKEVILLLLSQTDWKCSLKKVFGALAELRNESLNGERPNDHRGPDITTSETDQEDDEEHTKPSKPSPFFETDPQAGRMPEQIYCTSSGVAFHFADCRVVRPLIATRAARAYRPCKICLGLLPGATQ